MKALVGNPESTHSVKLLGEGTGCTIEEQKGRTESLVLNERWKVLI